MKGGSSATYLVQISFLEGYEIRGEEETELSSSITAVSQHEALAEAVRQYYGDEAYFEPTENECSGTIGQIFSKGKRNAPYSETGRVQVSVTLE